MDILNPLSHPFSYSIGIICMGRQSIQSSSDTAIMKEIYKNIWFGWCMDCTVDIMQALFFSPVHKTIEVCMCICRCVFYSRSYHYPHAHMHSKGKVIDLGVRTCFSHEMLLYIRRLLWKLIPFMVAMSASYRLASWLYNNYTVELQPLWRYVSACIL